MEEKIKENEGLKYREGKERTSIESSYVYVIIQCGARQTIILCLFGSIKKKDKILKSKYRGLEAHWVGWGWLPSQNLSR